MHYSLEKLITGDKTVSMYFTEAAKKWREFYRANNSSPVSDWAKWISDQQIPFFEHQCGGRGLGQEVMAWSALATLYTTQDGFGDNEDLAVKVVEAFAASSVSLEVKSHMRRAADNYGLLDHPAIKKLGHW